MGSCLSILSQIVANSGGSASAEQSNDHQRPDFHKDDDATYPTTAPTKADVASIPSADTLRRMSITEAIAECWKRDTNRLRPGVDYVLNVQEGKKPYWQEDKAADPLFTRVDPSVWRRPTFAAFYALVDNYHSDTGKGEKLGAQEQAEIDRFLTAIMATEPMRLCVAYCHAHDSHVPANQHDFQQKLRHIWFDAYNRERGGEQDSSGFEHVFVGEVRDGEISGFHNWIQFYHEEKAGRVDYRGYIKPKDKNARDVTDSNDHVLTVQFRWKNVEKQIGSIFIGVSPEWEMAIYTICFLCGSEKNKIELRTDTDVFDMEIVCYKMHGDRIGTTYPYVLSHHDA